jgi:AAA+ ATPase superfamily predicted ATPase
MVVSEITISEMNKFYNREKEIQLLQQIKESSTTSGQFTVVTGRRRIGKTQLLLKTFEGERFLYFFVARKSEMLLCSDFQAEISQKLAIPLFGNIQSITTIFEFLINYSKQENLTLIVDEFQELLHINPSIFSDLQRLWDLNSKNCKLNLIVSGSIISLMYKIFEDKSEPLFGRANHKLHIKAFETKTLKEILLDYHPKYTPEDLLALYSFTGGVAKYVQLFMENKAFTKDKMIAYLISEQSLLINEGKNILIEEFGRDYGIYFSILSEIAQGHTKRSELEDILNREIGGYLTKMERDFNLIKRATPIFSKNSESKNMKYILEDNFLIFWFRFIYKYQHILEIGANEQLQRIITRDYETFSGGMLEKYFRTKAMESKKFTNIGNYWDRKGSIEIDYIALNEIDKTIDFGEVKRNKKKIDLVKLHQKITLLSMEIKFLSLYEISLVSLSLEDM